MHKRDCTANPKDLSMLQDNMTKKEIPVETGIPVPRNQVTIKWPFHDMEINQNFLVPKGKRGIVAAHASRMKSSTGKVFTVRLILNKDTGKKEVRCWRLK